MPLDARTSDLQPARIFQKGQRYNLPDAFPRGRMKKLAIGCGTVVLVFGVLVVGVGYYGFLKVRSTVTQFAELGKIPEMEREVRVKGPFTPPISGELTASQVDRIMQVQQRIRE